MNKALDKTKVLLGLSGGVDSTAAALLLKKNGLTVSGLFFDVHEKKSENAYLAEKTAAELGIDFIYKNVNPEFTENVIKNFCSEYEQGRTPNPCALCNPTVKFKTLIEEADKIGAYYIATGHYARIHHDEKESCYYVQQAENITKDQSYMLYRLGQDVLSRLILPLNEVTNKEATRDIVRTEKINNAERKDSQEICFIGNNENYMDYIRNKGYIPKKGNFIDQNGNVLGVHQGIAHYTIGQRKGLGMTFGKPMFVIKVNHNDNTVTLGSNEDLFQRVVISENNIFVLPEGKDITYYHDMEVYAKIRYASKLAPATIHVLDHGQIEACFHEQQRAVTPGQSIVFYKGDLVIGGGFIK